MVNKQIVGKSSGIVRGGDGFMRQLVCKRGWYVQYLIDRREEEGEKEWMIG